MVFLVSAIITAAGKNTRMREDQNKKNLLIKNKLLLDIQGKPIILHTLNRVLNSDVDDCIIVLGHFKEEIVVVLNDLEDNRIKIVENNRFDVPLSQSLLNGVKNSKGDICLCAAADQPTISTKTFFKLYYVIYPFGLISYNKNYLRRLNNLISIKVLKTLLKLLPRDVYKL